MQTSLALMVGVMLSLVRLEIMYRYQSHKYKLFVHQQFISSNILQTLANAGEVAYRDLDLGISMQFVLQADYAPFAARRDAFIDIGGIDESFGHRGECKDLKFSFNVHNFKVTMSNFM